VGQVAKMVSMLTVTVTRDFWDWLGLWATVIAMVLALVALGAGALAIHRGNVIASNADEALVRERRSTFELGVLARLVEVSGHSLPGSLQVVRGLLQVLPIEDLPRMREEVARGVVPSNDLLDKHLEEYKQAVNRRLHGASIRPEYKSR
jgi:hypothetical protein